MLIKQNKGIGLLELMLALAIMAIVMLVTVRYYTNAKAKQEATTLVDSFNTLRSATENYLANNPLTVPASNITTTLISQGYLPASFGTVSGSTVTVNKNNWGGTINVIFTGNQQQFQVIQTQIPAGVCNMALGQIQGTLNMGETAIANNGQQTNGSTGCGSNGITTITATYNI